MTLLLVDMHAQCISALLCHHNVFAKCLSSAIFSSRADCVSCTPHVDHSTPSLCAAARCAAIQRGAECGDRQPCCTSTLHDTRYRPATAPHEHTGPSREHSMPPAAAAPSCLLVCCITLRPPAVQVRVPKPPHGAQLTVVGDLHARSRPPLSRAPFVDPLTLTMHH